MEPALAGGGVPGVELAGYLESAVGVGEAARRYLGALRSAGVPVRPRDVPLPGRDRVRAELPVGLSPRNEDIAVNLLCLNPEQMIPYLSGPEAPSREGRLTVGLWSWEVDVLPPGWREASRGLAQVWTYSRFSAGLIGAALDVPVLGFPPPLASHRENKGGSSEEPPRADLPAGFRVLVMFDYLSTLERKNPLGAIEAYRRAFDPADGAVLVVKSINGQHRPERHSEVRAALAGRPDIVQIDRTISGDERDALIAACDCYLSLHRSEGHGMPLAEAMALGKPVVTTAYGGNIEFMNPDNSYLVDWAQARVPDGVEHYPAGASWAEPDVEHASGLLRTARHDAEADNSRARRGQADVQMQLAPAVVGARMRASLQALGSPQRRRRFALRLNGKRNVGR
jgi:glycosyltransferase involved in cell wall biosynthesis